MESTTDTRIHEGKPHSLNLKATVHAVLSMEYVNFPQTLPGVHPLVAPLIMFRLKRRGFSNCRVDISDSTLVVYADR